MKRILLTVIVMAFAVAVQAGDAKVSQDKGQDKPACCASKVKTSTEANDAKDEGGCPFAKAACCSKLMPAKQTTAKQPVLLSPKAADTAR
jgi:hypothetical protein